VPDGSVAWWEGCRRFGYGSGLPERGVALDRGRWVVLSECEAQRRQDEIERGKEKLGRILADILRRTWQRVVDTYCPRCLERIRTEKGTKIDDVPCGNGTCPDLTPAQREWLARQPPTRPPQSDPRRRRRKAEVTSPPST
jgi:hypothetical protein